jgi:hypothetical protein
MAPIIMTRADAAAPQGAMGARAQRLPTVAATFSAEHFIYKALSRLGLGFVARSARSVERPGPPLLSRTTCFTASGAGLFHRGRWCARAPNKPESYSYAAANAHTVHDHPPAPATGLWTAAAPWTDAQPARTTPRAKTTPPPEAELMVAPIESVAAAIAARRNMRMTYSSPPQTFVPLYPTMSGAFGACAIVAQKGLAAPMILYLEGTAPRDGIGPPNSKYSYSSVSLRPMRAFWRSETRQSRGKMWRLQTARQRHRRISALAACRT